MGPKETTAALNNLTVQVVGRLLGLELPLTGSICCPFADHNDSKPSFAVLGGGRRWICCSCGRQGGAIDLVKELRNLPFIEAKLWLSDITGIGVRACTQSLSQPRIVEQASQFQAGKKYSVKAVFLAILKNLKYKDKINARGAFLSENLA